MIDDGDFTRPYTEALHYTELTGPERYELMGRSSQESAFKIGVGESLKETLD